jgi:glycosyltransferase involved in cell wall biosynthesis
MAVAPGAPRVVLYLQCDAGLYGSGVSLLELASHLPRSRYRPIVALPEEGPLGDALRARDVEVVVVPFGALRRAFRPDEVAAILWQNLRGPRTLARLIRARSVDVVHTNSTHVIAGVAAARRAGRPHIGHLQENLLPPKCISRAVARFIWRHSDRAIAISRATARELLGLQDGHPKLRIIYHAVDPDAFPPGGDPAAARARLGWGEAPHVGIVARLTAWKGHETFLRAAALLAAQHPTVRFAVIGDADTRRNEAHKARMVRLAQQLGIAPRVRWTGFVRPVHPLLAALDVSVVPSIRPEPFGIALIEAMATERPVVASNHGGPAEILAHGGGLLVAPGDAPATAAAVLALIRDDQWRVAMGRVGREQVMARFSIGPHVDAVVAVYDELLRAGAARREGHGSLGHHRLHG